MPSVSGHNHSGAQGSCIEYAAHPEQDAMKASLQPGLAAKFSFAVPENKTVLYLYPEAPACRSY